MSESSERERAIQRVALIDSLGLNEEVQNVFFAERVDVKESRTFTLDEIKNLIAEHDGWNPADLQVLDIWISEQDGTLIEVVLDVRPEVSMEKVGKDVTYFFKLKSEANYSRPVNKVSSTTEVNDQTEIDKTFFGAEIQPEEAETQDHIGGFKDTESHKFLVYREGKWVKGE